MAPPHLDQERLQAMAAQISMWTKVDPELLETLRLPGFMFRLTEKLLWEAFDQFFDGFRAKGAYVFECQRSRYLGLLPTWDPWEVIASMGTHADNFDLDTEQIISWLTALNRDQPFTLCGAGYDFVAGRFVTKIESSRTVARRIFEFCPDAVTELTGSLPALALSIKRRREFLLWWD